MANSKREVKCLPPDEDVKDKAKLLDLITPREKEVLSLLAGGYTNPEIATCLHISKHTVKNHVSSIYRKLEMNDRTQIALLAIRNGFAKVE